LKGSSIIPLEKIHHNVSIISSIAKIEVVINYTNKIDYPIEAIFYFAISSSACFDGLEAKIGNKII